MKTVDYYEAKLHVLFYSNTFHDNTALLDFLSSCVFSDRAKKFLTCLKTCQRITDTYTQITVHLYSAFGITNDFY